MRFTKRRLTQLRLSAKNAIGDWHCPLLGMGELMALLDAYEGKIDPILWKAMRLLDEVRTDTVTDPKLAAAWVEKRHSLFAAFDRKRQKARR